MCTSPKEGHSSKIISLTFQFLMCSSNLCFLLVVLLLILVLLVRLFILVLNSFFVFLIFVFRGVALGVLVVVLCDIHDKNKTYASRAFECGGMKGARRIFSKSSFCFVLVDKETAEDSNKLHIPNSSLFSRALHKTHTQNERARGQRTPF